MRRAMDRQCSFRPYPSGWYLLVCVLVRPPSLLVALSTFLIFSFLFLKSQSYYLLLYYFLFYILGGSLFFLWGVVGSTLNAFKSNPSERTTYIHTEPPFVVHCNTACRLLTADYAIYSSILSSVGFSFACTGQS